MTANDDHMLRQRLLAAAQIERRLACFAEEVGLFASDLNWNLGQGLRYCESHRLDFQIQGVQVRMYFLETEMIDYAINPHCSKVEARLEDVVDTITGIDLPPADDIYLTPVAPRAVQ